MAALLVYALLAVLPVVVLGMWAVIAANWRR
jgi:hypothetical protein